jgi:ubiquinone/menaquinone biosynthesis C-methylase UbiE
MSFERLAPYYRAMERVLAGGKLQHCRAVLLPRLTRAREVLVVGEGPGRWIEVACRALPHARFTVVDASAGMLREAQASWLRAGGELERIRFVQARLPAEVPVVAGGYDVVVTPFFLDCFAPGPLAEVVACLAEVAGEEACWLVCDFRVPTAGLARWRAVVVLALAHGVFRLMTDISARRLTDPGPWLAEQGFYLEEEETSEWGLLSASLWRRGGVDRFGGCEREPGR